VIAGRCVAAAWAAELGHDCLSLLSLASALESLGVVHVALVDARLGGFAGQLVEFGASLSTLVLLVFVDVVEPYASMPARATWRRIWNASKGSARRSVRQAPRVLREQTLSRGIWTGRAWPPGPRAAEWCCPRSLPCSCSQFSSRRDRVG
jgi:hypothetical protein